jgi:hypothetical protein
MDGMGRRDAVHAPAHSAAHSQRQPGRDDEPEHQQDARKQERV